MKKVKTAQELAERLDLPAEALGAVRLTLTGGRLLLVENHSGLQEYGSERIAVGCGSGRVVVSGSGLDIEGMNKTELVLRGRIQMLEWEG